jgi:hypothetical protein
MLVVAQPLFAAQHFLYQNSENNTHVVVAAVENHSLRCMNSSARRQGLHEIRDVTNDLALCIQNLSNHTQRNTTAEKLLY